ncbi:serine hydrolase [Saccharopolyspora taberi]|uniref:serine hydrolase n=1 Tax=Saccharopolyspora taberi TaxID=60895 RepID=UPI0031D64C78
MRGERRRLSLRRRAAFGLCLPVAVVAGVLGLFEASAVKVEEVRAPVAAPAAPPEHRAAAAAGAIDDWASDQDSGVFAMAVLDRRTGEYAESGGARTTLYSASLSKLVVAVDVLDRSGRIGEPDLDLVRRALGPSEDEAMNALWERFDGPGAIGRVAGALGLSDTRPPADPARWGETLTSARDVVRLFEHVLTGMDPADRDFVMTALHDAPATGGGGFDQRYGLGAVPSSGVKSAWMCCQQARTTLHSAGVTDSSHRFVVALLSSQPAVGYGPAREKLTEAATVLRAGLDN